jgi:hypothetical protein
MSMDEYEDCFIFRCDGCGLTAEFARGAPGSFMACVGEIKDRGWRISRDQLWRLGSSLWSLQDQGRC